MLSSSSWKKTTSPSKKGTDRIIRAAADDFFYEYYCFMSIVYSEKNNCGLSLLKPQFFSAREYRKRINSIRLRYFPYLQKSEAAGSPKAETALRTPLRMASDAAQAASEPTVSIPACGTETPCSPQEFPQTESAIILSPSPEVCTG